MGERSNEKKQVQDITEAIQGSDGTESAGDLGAAEDAS